MIVQILADAGDVVAHGNGEVAQRRRRPGRWFTPAFVESGAPAIRAIVDDLLATDPAGYAGCCAAIRDMDLRPSVSGIALPALVIGGSYDPATPVAHSEALQAAIAGAQLALLPAAHLSSIECPEAFNAAALDFLRA